MDKIELLENQIKELKQKIANIKEQQRAANVQKKLQQSLKRVRLNNIALETKKQNRQKQILYVQNLHQKIRSFRQQFEEEGMFITEIAQKVPCSKNTAAKLIKREMWSSSNSQRRKKEIAIKCFQNAKKTLPTKQQSKHIPVEKIEIIEAPELIKPYKEVNQFKKKIEYEPIEWSDEIAPEIKIKRKVKEKDFDPLQYAEELMQEAEKNSISVKGKKCKRCGGFLAAFGEEQHNCRKNT